MRAQPDVAQPDVAQPDVAQPDVAQPDALSADARPHRPRMALVLMADTGAGHRSAAIAIRDAIQANATQIAGGSDWTTLVVDGIKACGRFPFRNWVFLYGPATKYNPRLFGAFFHVTNTPRRVDLARRLCQPFLAPGLRELIARERPDVIVSTHPIFHQVVPHVLRDLGLGTPLVGVITDLITIHYVWAAPGVDAWVAPSTAARQFLLDRGIPADRIHQLGLPIRPDFAPAASVEAPSLAERRAALGLDPNLPMVLLAGGGEGVGGLAGVARALEAETLPAQLVVVTGRNRALHAELLRRRAHFRMPTRVLGFAANMPELMCAADVLVSKAGSLSIAEALAAGLPIVLMGALPGQEEGNVAFVMDHAVGRFAPTPGRVVAELRALLTPGEATLSRMRANTAQLGRPKAAHAVAELIFAQVADAQGRAPPEAAAVASGEGNSA